MADGSGYLFEVIPSLGTQNKTWEDVEKKLEVARNFAKTIHVDIVDGKFAETITFMDPAPFAKYKDVFILEVHLMTENPMQYVKPFADAGFKRFIGHIEKIEKVEEFVAQCQMYGAVGLAIDAPTSVDTFEKVNLEDLDFMTVMTVKAGVSGQDFMTDQLEKVKKIRADANEKVVSPEFSIEVDGGVNAETILQAKEAGANRFTVTSAIFGEENPKDAFEKLRGIIEK